MESGGMGFKRQGVQKLALIKCLLDLLPQYPLDDPDIDLGMDRSKKVDPPESPHLDRSEERRVGKEC